MSVIITTEHKKKIVQRLKNIQRNLNYSNREMADLFGVSNSQYKKISNGTSELNLDKLLILSIHSGINMNYLFNVDSDEEMYLKDKEQNNDPLDVEKLYKDLLSLPKDKREEKAKELLKIVEDLYSSIIHD